MHRLFRLSALLTALLLVLAACQGNGGGTSTAPSASGGGGGSSQDPTAACSADKFGCVEVASGDPITIGTALVTSGANSSLGLDSQFGVEVAVNMKNDEGGVRGHQIEMENQDSQCTAEGGTAAARALVSAGNIAAAIGTSCSSAGVPAAEITSEAGMLLVSPSNTAPSLTDPSSHQPFYARTAHNDKVQGAAMAQFVCEELKLDTAATIHDGSPYAQQLQQVFADNFKSQCNGTVTKQEAITVGQTDFSAVLTSIAADSPKFLYYPIFVAEGALITQQARQTSGLDDTVLAGADGILTPDFLSAAGDAAEGMYMSGPDLAFSGDFYESTFLPAYKEVSGEDAPISVFHAHAFDAANMIFAAIDKVAIEGSDGKLYIPRTALKDAFLETKDYDGITGKLSCDENGDCANPKISVSQVKDGKFERIWPTQ